MGKKSKKSKKIKQKKQQRLINLSFDQLVEEGHSFASSGKPRDAIKMYKMAIKAAKSAEQSDSVRSSLFQSYLAREKELRQKKMTAEADNVKKQSMEYMPDPSSMDHSTMLSFIKICDNKTAFDTCAKYFKKNGTDSPLETLLAERLVTQNCWNFLEILDDTLPVKRDAETIRDSLSAMNEGDWSKAMDSMKGLPRTSPFAHIRMFCRAMASFCDGNDKAMLKAISLIPETSTLRKITDTLESSIKSIAEHTELAGDKAVIDCLWKGPVNAWKTAENLIELVDKEKYTGKMKSLIISFANQIFPDGAEYARQYLMETLWQPNKMIEQDLIRMEREVLGKNANLLEAKRNLVFFNKPIENASKYLAMLKKSDSESKTAAITESIIILNICRYIMDTGDSSLLEITSDTAKKRFGISPKEDFQTSFLQFAHQGIKCDPENRALYEVVAQFESSSRNAKKLKEDLLLLMCEAYPEDPYPCIELASLYHGKNAFRKAENILKKAMELAPYDSRVLDQHVIALIISADKNLNASRFHLVWQDVEKAGQFDSKKNEILLEEKKLFYKICEKPEMPEKIIKLQLNEFSLFDRLKIISMISMDIKNRYFKSSKKITNKINSIFKSELKNIEQLTSKQTLELLMPFPKEWKYAFVDRNVHRLFFNASKDAVNNLDNNDLIKLIDTILTPDLFTFFRKEIEKRINNSKNIDSLLKFYAITLEGLEDNYWDVDEYYYLIDDADQEMEQKLRDAGHRLSKHTQGPYKHALKTFEFEVLEDMFSPSFNFFDDDEDDDDDDYYYYDEDEDDPFLNPFAGSGMPDINDLPSDFIKFIKKKVSKNPNSPESREFNALFDDVQDVIEDFIDETGLRGLPKEILKTMKSEVKKDPVIREAVTMVKLLFLKEAKKKFSQEAKALFL